MQKEILGRLGIKGLKASLVSIAHVPELQNEFRVLHENNEISDGVSRMLSNMFRYDQPEGLTAKSLLCIATPSPVGCAVFDYKGEKRATYIPPTYADYTQLPRKLVNKLNSILRETGYGARYSNSLPYKLLAVRSGLARYGRNNIVYVDGMGSFIFLSVYFTDMPCEEDTWREAQRMDLCGKCRKCLESCPTGAIKDDRRVIDAERCLTMHNEADSSAPFPEWLSPSAHNCLVGCLACQAACPMNQRYLDYISSPVEFDTVETALFLKGTPEKDLP